MKVVGFLLLICAVNAQYSCPNGVLPIAACNQQTRTCDTDRRFGCSLIGSLYFCCEPATTSNTCVDTDQRCPNFKNYCTSQQPQTKEMMQNQCRKTCGFCNAAAQDNSLCGDRNSQCDSIKHMCLAETKYVQDLMKSLCAKTCGMCPGQVKQQETVCVDQNPDCNSIKIMCTHPNEYSQSIMRVQCRKTCGFCYGNNPLVTNSTECRDIDPTCASFTGLCSDESASTRDLMKNRCAKTCGYCDGKIPQPKKADNSQCKDTNPNCNSYLGLCNTDLLQYLSLVKTQCRKTCGFCGGCVDLDPDCARLGSMCNNPNPAIRNSMQMCKKTCGWC
ncbi:hypothetical protein M3Y97_01154200 [Aphelenchoides bicaudatus]|nr:hypothetical protein M3Y97_01154200 [Aphelenchoides bicaudatus]